MTEQEKREKVIKGLEKLREYADSEVHPVVSPDNWDTYSKLRDLIDEAEEDALALLKVQEAVSVQKKHMEMVGLQTWDWVCGNCGQTVLFSAKFCPWCGRAVKWGD